MELQDVETGKEEKIEISDLKKKARQIQMKNKGGRVVMNFIWSNKLKTIDQLKQIIEIKSLEQILNGQANNKDKNLDSKETSAKNSKNDDLKKDDKNGNAVSDDNKDQQSAKDSPKDGSGNEDINKGSDQNVKNKSEEANKLDDNKTHPVSPIADEGTKPDSSSSSAFDFRNTLAIYKEIENGLKIEDPSYTYYNHLGLNKIYVELKFYDNEYRDEHHYTVFGILNFKSEIKLKKLEIPTKDGIMNDPNTATKDTIKETTQQSTKKDSTDKSKEGKLKLDPQVKSKNKSEIQIQTVKNNKSETSKTTDQSDTTDNNSHTSKTDSKSNEVKSDDGSTSKKDSTQIELRTIEKYNMRLQTAVLEPFLSVNYNVRTYSSFNFNTLFKCAFRGNLIFNENIFGKIEDINGKNEVNWNEIIIDNLKNNKDAIKFRLFSPDPNCPINLTADLKLKEDKLVLKTFLFMVFVLVVGKEITEYKQFFYLELLSIKFIVLLKIIYLNWCYLLYFELLTSAFIIHSHLLNQRVYCQTLVN